MDRGSSCQRPRVVAQDARTQPGGVNSPPQLRRNQSWSNAVRTYGDVEQELKKAQEMIEELQKLQVPRTDGTKTPPSGAQEADEADRTSPLAPENVPA